MGKVTEKFEEQRQAELDRARKFLPQYGEPVIQVTLVDFAVSNGDRSSDMGDFPEPGAFQEFADECDINKIMEQYEKTGVVSHINPREPVYLDVSDLPSLGDSLDLMKDAEAAFMSLPAVARREFDNDPVKFVEFATNEENLPKLREWGLAVPEKAAPQPISVRVIPDDPLPDPVPGPAK